MQIAPAMPEQLEPFATDIPELVWATGPVSYDYHFRDRKLFNAVVSASWRHPGTLFAAETSTLATDSDQLLGIEIGMPGDTFRARQRALTAVWEALIAADQAEPQIIADVVERSAHASWLNPVLSADTYYVHAIAVKPDCRGRGIGYRLLDNAIRSARNSGFTHLQLDVLADNPAVRFYESMGLEVLAETRAPKPAAFGVPTEFRMGLLLR